MGGPRLVTGDLLFQHLGWPAGPDEENLAKVFARNRMTVLDTRYSH